MQHFLSVKKPSPPPQQGMDKKTEKKHQTRKSKLALPLN
jgi:hypothetical protein